MVDNHADILDLVIQNVQNIEGTGWAVGPLGYFSQVNDPTA